MPDTASVSDLLRVLIPTLIGAVIGLIGPVLYARLARRRKQARPVTRPDGPPRSDA